MRRRARLCARAERRAQPRRAAPRVPRAHIPLPLSSTSAAVSCAEPPSLAMVAAVAFRALTPPLPLSGRRGGNPEVAAAVRAVALPPIGNQRARAQIRPKRNTTKADNDTSGNDLGNNAWFKV